MSGLQPVAVYAMRIPPGDIMVPAVPSVPGYSATFRVTMAAVDPSAEPVLEDTEDKRPPRATLKMIRIASDSSDDDSDEDFEDDSDDDISDEEENGGPSDKKSRKLKMLEALAAEEEDDEDEEMEDDDDSDDDENEQAAAAALLKQLIKGGKGKGKAIAGAEDEDEDDDESVESAELDEVVLCTLDPEKHFNQPLELVIGERDNVFFKVSGTHTVHLTGNFVLPADDGSDSMYDDDEEDYDLSPDEDELDALEDGDEESDELDDLEDPRVTEVGSDEEAEVIKLTAGAKSKGKGKNKRPADDSDADEASLDAIVAKSIKDDAMEEPKKLTKAEKKAAKKLKKNDGEAAPAGTSDKKPEINGNGSEKKVQFAKNLEQGPTPSGTSPASKKSEVKKDDPEKAPVANGSSSTSLGVRDVKGVSVDDRKIGSGPGAKKNSKVEMRYIGKLENGKVFDSNKSGKPFSFKLGTGQVISGWDIGLEGISAGGERRITIPPHLAYGNKNVPGIPKNSKLIFDVKCLSVK